MTIPEFVLALINASGGEIRGRTMLQKMAYFASRLGAIDIDFRYHAYYYGRYSDYYATNR